MRTNLNQRMRDILPNAKSVMPGIHGSLLASLGSIKPPRHVGFAMYSRTNKGRRLVEAASRFAITLLTGLFVLSVQFASAQEKSPLEALPTVPQQTGSQAAEDGRDAVKLTSTGQVREFDAGELIAVVGDAHILAGDMHVFVAPIIEQYREQIASEAQEKMIRFQLTRQALPQYVSIKVMYQEFFRDIVGSAAPKELADMKKQVSTRAGKLFFEKQVPHLFKKYEVNDISALETALRKKGLSLVTLRTQFVEQALAQELERKYVPDEYEIDNKAILDYYREHRSDYQIPSRAKWRQLTVRFDNHPSRAEAERKIKDLGNQIFLGGKPFEAVAKQGSEGFTADSGGLYDWTSKGSLKSEPLDEALFRLPLDRLSQVIEDDVGFHVIEVLEREEAHEKDLAEVQAEIRQILSEKRREKERQEFRERVMKRMPIWTRWPEDIPDSRPLSDAIGESSDK